MHVCVQIWRSAVPWQIPVVQNCGYVHLSPSMPVGASQKHLPASHFWPVAHAVASAQGAPFVTVIVAESVSAPMSSYALSTRSITPSGTVDGVVSVYCAGSG